MTSQTSANRYTQELENMERLFVRLTKDFEQEMLIAADMTYKPILQTLNNADIPLIHLKSTTVNR